MKLRKYYNFGTKNPRRAWHVVSAQEVDKDEHARIENEQWIKKKEEEEVEDCNEGAAKLSESVDRSRGVLVALGGARGRQNTLGARSFNDVLAPYFDTKEAATGARGRILLFLSSLAGASVPRARPHPRQPVETFQWTT